MHGITYVIKKKKKMLSQTGYVLYYTAPNIAIRYSQKKKKKTEEDLKAYSTQKEEKQRAET